MCVQLSLLRLAELAGNIHDVHAEVDRFGRMLGQAVPGIGADPHFVAI